MGTQQRSGSFTSIIKTRSQKTNETMNVKSQYQLLNKTKPKRSVTKQCLAKDEPVSLDKSTNQIVAAYDGRSDQDLMNIMK